VSIVESVGYHGGNAQRLIDWKLTFTLQPLAERFTLHIRHDEVGKTVRLTGVYEGHDMGVFELGDGLYLAQEAVRTDGGGQLGMQDLDGNLAVIQRGTPWPCRRGRSPTQRRSGRQVPT